MNNNSIDNLKIQNLDYKETDDKFIIYDVPIAAELVQPYEDGFAFKSAEEISKIKVDNVPVTMRADYPGHPDNHLTGSSTDFKADQTVGFLSEPSGKKTLDPRKRYADYILYKNDLTEKVIETFKEGKIIDTSIGFLHEKVLSKGVHDGVAYDYLQTNIVLDHNSILMDAQGHIGIGRMPSPIGGIGADSITKGDIMDKKNDAPEEQTNNLTAEQEETKAPEEVKETPEAEETEESSETEETEAPETEVKEGTDSLKAEVDSLKAEKDAINEKLKVAEDELKKYKDAEKKVIDNMREELVNSNPDFKELFVEAKDDLIKKYHQKMVAKDKKSHSISADMFGAVKDSPKKDGTDKWIKNTKEQKVNK